MILEQQGNISITSVGTESLLETDDGSSVKGESGDLLNEWDIDIDDARRQSALAPREGDSRQRWFTN